jgi:hypothetical protein
MEPRPLIYHTGSLDPISRKGTGMSTLVQGPAAQTFGLDASPYQTPFSPQPGAGNPSGGSGGGGAVDFGSSANLGLQNNQIHFGGQAQQASVDKTASAGQAGQSDDVMARVRDLVQQILQLLAQFTQQNQNGNAGATQNNSGGNSSGSGNGRGAVAPTGGAAAPEQTAAQPTTSPAPVQKAETPAPISPTGQGETANTAVTGDSQGTAKTSATPAGGSQTSGTGAYSLDITNTDDETRKYGEFDKNENLVGEITLKPGEKGTLKYEADTTTLVKQQDEDGKYHADAARLEAYNKFVNTSDIDGRDAHIYATDGKGFEIGDKKSIAAEALKQGVIKNLDDTIPGWYDGSTAEMQKGGAFLEQQLGTGDTYIHPNDDQLGQGKNPMRSSNSMSLDVEFGKA